MTFQTLGLCAPILTALEEHGYERPSPIQEKAIPPALAGRDVLGCAQTGTGKTCAFAAPILQRLSASRVQGHPLRALILTPTRELAIQIEESFLAYGKHLSLRCAVIFGGVGQNPQVEALGRGVDVLVATPGRLMDLYQQGFVKLDQLEIFVLDEADRMLDMGFIHDVKKILKWLPRKKQTMLFSATMPPEIAELVNSLLHDPVRVAVDPVSSPVEAIQQSVYFVDKNNKTKLLAHLIEERPGVHPHQARGQQGGRGPGEGGHHRRRHPRQQEPDRPAAGPGRLQGREDPVPGGHRHRRPGAGHRGALPRVQLQPPRGARDLRPPHRPHRPGRTGGGCRRLLRLWGEAPAQGY